MNVKQNVKLKNKFLTGGKCDAHVAVFFETSKMIKITMNNLVLG